MLFPSRIWRKKWKMSKNVEINRAQSLGKNGFLGGRHFWPLWARDLILGSKVLYFGVESIFNQIHNFFNIMFTLCLYGLKRPILKIYVDSYVFKMYRVDHNLVLCRKSFDGRVSPERCASVRATTIAPIHCKKKGTTR